MGIENKLLKIEREMQEVVRLSELGAQTLVKLDLNYTDLIIRDNEGTEQAKFPNASREDRKKANEEASFLDEFNPTGAPHTIEAKSAITFKEDGTLDFGDAAFGVEFPTAEINALIYDIEFYTDCENIKQMIDDQKQVLIDQISSKAPELANLAELNPLMSLPSDPLKILSWARKVVSKFFGPYTLAMIDLAIQLGLFAGALARLAGAISAAQQNLKLCAQSIKEDLVDDVLEKINEEIAGTVEKIDSVVDKIDDAQNKIGQITGKQPNFLPSSLAGGVSGLVQNLTDETRIKVLRAGQNAEAVPPSARTRQQKEDVARLERQRKQDEKDRADLVSNIDSHLGNTIPGLDMAAAKASTTGKIQTPSSVSTFTSEINEVVNRSFDDDPKAQADASAAAGAMGASLTSNNQFSSTVGASISANNTLAVASLATAGAVTTQQQFTVDGTTFTFENGILTAVA